MKSLQRGWWGIGTMAALGIGISGAGCTTPGAEVGADAETQAQVGSKDDSCESGAGCGDVKRKPRRPPPTWRPTGGSY